jgi:hypothetical protein
MIGLWAAVALLGGAVWLALDALYSSPQRDVYPALGPRLRRLQRMLVEADL